MRLNTGYLLPPSSLVTTGWLPFPCYIPRPHQTPKIDVFSSILDFIYTLFLTVFQPKKGGG